MATSNKARFHRTDRGITGAEFDKSHDDCKNVRRVDEDWPEDEFGAKVFHPGGFGDLLERLPMGTIRATTDGEAVDPPVEPMPGTREFGERARTRRASIQRSIDESAGRPYDPHDVESTDIISGKKTNLGQRRKDIEDAGNF